LPVLIVASMFRAPTAWGRRGGHVYKAGRVQPPADVAARLGVSAKTNRCCAGRTSSTPMTTR